jgi:hypothetical protein
MDVPGMRRSRGINVSIEHKAETVEYGAQPDQPWVTGILPLARGTVQLVIDMPARSTLRIVTAATTSLLMFAIMATTWSLLALLPVRGSAPSFTQPVLAAAAVGVLGFVLFLVMTGAGASREVLEVDSRFVSVTRSREAVVLLPRGCCTEVKLADVPTSGLAGALARRGSDVPRLLLGDGGNWWISAGSGITREAAVRLVVTIREFLAENPVESGFDEPDGVLRLYYPKGTRGAVRVSSSVKRNA